MNTNKNNIFMQKTKQNKQNDDILQQTEHIGSSIYTEGT